MKSKHRICVNVTENRGVAKETVLRGSEAKMSGAENWPDYWLEISVSLYSYHRALKSAKSRSVPMKMEVLHDSLRN